MPVGGSDPLYWTTEHTRAFLRSQPWAGERLLSAVRAFHIDGENLLQLTSTDLEEFGIDSAADRQRILRKISLMAPETQSVRAGRVADMLAEKYSAEELEEAAARVQAAAPEEDPLWVAPVNRVVTPRKGAPSKYSAAGKVAAARPGSSEIRRGPVPSYIFAERSAEPSAPPRRSGADKMGDARLQISRTDRGVTQTKAKRAKEAKAQADRQAEERRIEEEEAALALQYSPKQKKLRSSFKFIDVDDSGIISGQELEDLLMMCYPKYGWEKLRELHDAIMEECDADNNGTITIDEFVNSKYAQELSLPAEAEEKTRERQRKLQSAFDEVDRDGSGRIDYEELKVLIAIVFPSVGPVGQEEYRQAIIKECDADGNGRIDFDEFWRSEYANMLSRPAELGEAKEKRQDKLREQFASVDKDNSGVIDHAELRNLLATVFADYDEKTINLYFDVISSECDADGSGTISLDEFINSEYANMLAGIEEDHPKEKRTEGSNVSYVARTDRIKQRRRDMIKNTQNLAMTNMGTLIEGDTPPESPRTSAIDRMTGRDDTPEPDKKQYKEKPAHLMSTEEELAVLERERLAAAQEILTGGHVGHIGRFQGPMERERRFTSITNLFHKWDESSDISHESSGFIEYQELRAVLQRFFNWTDKEATDNADAIMKQMDGNMDGKLDWKEFVTFITSITKEVSAGEFDSLIKFIHECIGEVSEDWEFERRDKLLGSLFQFWDYDEGGFVDQRELGRVMTRYNGGEGASGDKFVELAMGAVDDNADGRLDVKEFSNFFQGLSFRFTPDDFDFMLFRLRRCVEQVHFLLEGTRANIKYRATMENHLASTELQAILTDSKPTNPIILYGVSYDPARAVEKCAKMNGRLIEPCMVTHFRGERGAIHDMQRKGFQRGEWIYFVLSEHHDLDGFLRQVGVELATNGFHIHEKFRLWIHAPFVKVTHFPHMITLNAILKNLDDVIPPEKRKAGVVG